MTESTRLQNILEKGLNGLSLDLNPEPLLTYLSYLHKWNQAYNLTAIRDEEAMVTHHLLDSLAILPWVKGSNIIDVGTGPGLPGIPLAIARPQDEITLLDSNGKKINFLREIKRQLCLKNIHIIQSRVEEFAPQQAFDTVVSRAFSQIKLMIDRTSHLIASDGIFLAMKGRNPQAELKEIDRDYSVASYQVPGLDGSRCCVVIPS